jgi:peptidyl-dipeptidase Dcp
MPSVQDGPLAGRSKLCSENVMNDPFLKDWTSPFGLPPFDEISSEHFRPAFERALIAHNRDIDTIINSKEPANFANTIEALERAGHELDRVNQIFWNLASAHTNDQLQAIEREMSPLLARHSSAIYMNSALFERVEKVWAQRGETGLTDEQLRVLDLTRRAFIRSGAQLKPEQKVRLADIIARLASLGTQFSQNVLQDETSFTLALDNEDDLAGLSASQRDNAAQAARDRNLISPYVVTLSRSSIEPFLQFSSRRDLRQKAFQAWIMRGEQQASHDNRPLIAEILHLRAERARLLGFATFADFKLNNTMAKTPSQVRALLQEVWNAAKAKAHEEQEALEALARSEGDTLPIQASDWRYYAEKLRKVRFDIDESELKPYLSLDQMIAAAFYTAERLFGLRFIEQKGLKLYHPDARAFEVIDRDNRHIALFISDYFARPSKRSGAWMSSFRDQHKLDGEIRPIILNVMNFSKPAHGQACLLSLDDARTLFHEFGHALHGMLSDVTYPLISGTSVARDFVELPSQLFEHWLMQPDVLRRFALHVQTKAPIPERLIERILAAKTFNQGFASIEYTASALVDLELHLLQPSDQMPDVMALEREVLNTIGMPDAITMRHRSPHFSHIFSGDGYSAGYYSYLWSEVLDADAFEAFVETGDPFHAEVAKRLKDHIYAAGGRQEPDLAYTAFRGRLPSTQALLRKKGLAA